jgi:hypothetical protein
VKSLVIWAEGASLDAARRLAGSGSVLFPWSLAARQTLEGAGLACAPPLEPADADRADEAAMSWTREFGRRPIEAGKSLRELLVWQDVPLWWAAEIYLHYTSEAPGFVRLIESYRRILEREAPDEVEAFGLTDEERLLLARTCVTCGVLFHGAAIAPRARKVREVRRLSLQSRLNTWKAAVTALKASLAGGAPTPRGSTPRLLFLSHAAFWRERRDAVSGELKRYEHYFDQLIPAIAQAGTLEPLVLAVGPSAAFRRRGAAQRLREWLRLRPEEKGFVHLNRYAGLAAFAEQRRATRTLRQQWRAWRGSSAMCESFSHERVTFADLAAPSLAGTLLLQLPWAAGLYAALGRALADIKPAALCLYAESSGLGRVALQAARAAGIPSVAVQHGIIYSRYYSYRHDADETDCPRPDRTALFGRAAERFLLEQGRYRADTLVVTGSPKFDALLSQSRTLDRNAIRARLGAKAGEALLVVASRYRGIRETHQSIGSAFSSLVAAVESLDGVRAIVKPHPAEPATGYEHDIRQARSTRVTVVAPGADLGELLVAADALVTVESLSAIEALVLDRPVLVLNTPTNLQELVESGAALGVARGENPLPVLHRLLFDQETREALGSARGRYLGDVAQGVDGRATERIAALLAETAQATRHGRV